MNPSRLTDFEIRALGWQILVERLGPSGALRFAIQTERGYGDYAELRHRQLGSLTVDELVALARKNRRSRKARGAQRRRAPR